LNIKARNKTITTKGPTFFIADIAANHDGDLNRALHLIELAAEAGADAAKFQHFKAETIVSDVGFADLGQGLAHQKKWNKKVFDVYRDAELPLIWTEKLKEKCDEVGVDFFSAIYDLNYLSVLSDSMPFFKVGSGDITWAHMLEQLIEHNKPIFLATGASTMTEVNQAMNILLSKNISVCLMQCNTNYTGDDQNSNYANLRVLNTYRQTYPDVILGLSDHTTTTTTTLGAVSLGATVIEKHFTDDRKRVGPDHSFSLDYKMWKEMVTAVRELESSLGDGIKKIEKNETESQIVQRRAARVNKSIELGDTIMPQDIIFLRPCPPGASTPFDVYGQKSILALGDLKKGDSIPLNWLNL
jgi:N-acetylneuraminate synthase